MTSLSTNCALPARRSLRLPLMTALRLHRSRRALTTLDDAALWDIGLTRAEALAEAKRPFWDLPSA